jgi:hypothetical protein
MWPSSRLAEIAVDRLDTCEYPHPYEHLRYEKAEHAIRIPYGPTVGRETGSGPEISYAFGGTPSGYAHADADSWSRQLEYLEMGLQD